MKPYYDLKYTYEVDWVGASWSCRSRGCWEVRRPVDWLSVQSA